MQLAIYILKRLLLLVPTLLGVSIVSFTLVRILPGDPVFMVVSPYATPEEIANARAQLHLEDPIPEQYIVYLQGLLKGDLGYAWHSSQPVTSDIAQRFPLSFELATISLILTLAMAIPLGVVSAVKQDSWIDNVARLFAVVGVSTPLFWSGLLLIYVFFFRLRWAPPPMGVINPLMGAPPTVTGMILVDSLLANNWPAFRYAAASLTLPAITLALSMMGSITRMTRSSMLEVLNSDYVRSAVAFGLPQRTVIFRDALQNALLSVVTMIGVLYGFALGGTVLVEVIFGLPGMGSYAYRSILNLDYAAVQGVVLVVAVIFIVINMLVDVAYSIIDPRIAYS